MLLIRQAAVYAPEYLGIKDVLICSNKIEAIEDHIDGEIPFCKVVDGHGKKLTRWRRRQLPHPGAGS